MIAGIGFGLGQYWLGLPLWSWMLLAGGAAAGLPVVLHLLQTARAPQVAFSTVRFLQQSIQETARRRKIQHWLLMVLRSLLVAMLAVALARPLWRADRWSPGGGGPYAAAIIVDNSLSMGVGGAGGTRLGRARRFARQILRGGVAPEDAAVLFTNGPQARDEVGLSADRAGLERRLDLVDVSIGRASLVITVSKAFDLLERARLPNRVVYLLTDLQASGLPLDELAGLVDGHRDIPLALVNCARGEPRNLAVTDLGVNGDGCVVGAGLEFIVTVRNGSAQPCSGTVRLLVDGEPIESVTQRVVLAAAGSGGDRQVLRMPHVFDRPGWHVGAVELRAAGDALPADNSRHFAIFVRERVSVLVVSGPASGLAGNDAGYYVRAALAAAGPVVRCGAIDAEQLDAGQVDKVDAIVLCNVPAVDAVGASALRALTVRGGSAVIFVGPDVQAKAWNALLGPSGGGEAWLPARLAGPTGPAGEAGGVLQRVADDHDLFAGLYEGQGQYRSVLVYRYFRVEPWDDCPGRPIAWLADGRALLIEKQYPCRAAEAGGVLLCTTTADAGWTNLPTRPVFAPLLLRAVLWPARRHLACASYLEGSRVRLRLSGRGGPPLEVQIPPDARGRSATLRVQPARSGGVAEYVFDETFQPGAYHWWAEEADGREGWFVVNPDGRESDLRAVQGDRLAALLKRSGGYLAASPDELGQHLLAARRGRGWWDYLLIAVLLGATLEVLLANRYRPAAAEPRAVRAWSPAGLASSSSQGG